MSYNSLISGQGSIGTRHAENLRSLGVKVVTCDPNTEADYTDFDEALREAKPDIVFVCSPTKLHISQALIAAKQGCHLFIEKPLSHALEAVDELKTEVQNRNLICMVGCNMRFHPGPKSVKEKLEHGDIGNITKAEIYTGSYLPDWRPQSDYKQSYSADPEQGGAILDCIHEIDLALWYFGPATLQDAKLQDAKAIGLDTEGTADLTLKHDSGVISNVHLSYEEKQYRRYCDIEGTEGNIHWDIADDPSDLNQMYIDEVKHFLECIEQNRSPMGNLGEAKMALTIALAAKYDTISS